MRVSWRAVAFGVGLVVVASAELGASSQERWVEARSTHFIVLSDAGEKDAVRLASHFERMRVVLETLLPGQDDGNGQPIQVVAVRDQRDLQRLEPAAYLAKGRVDLAGFFLHSLDKDFILVRVDEPTAHAYAVVYHEFTHAMLRKASAWMPLWLNEGLAQYYENTDFGAKSISLGEANPAQLRLLQRSDMLPLATLLKVDAASPLYHDEEEGSTFYAESWALTHYLTVNDRLQGTHRVSDYAERVALGEDSVTAATQAFGDLNKLQAALESYVMQRRFVDFTMPETQAFDANSVAVRAVTVAEADLVQADVMAHTGRSSEATALLDEVLQADANSGMAHETMGYLRYRAGDFAGAKRWLGEAVEFAPESYRAHAYLAAAMLRGGDRGDDAAIEANLREAIRLNPEFAPAYDTLAMLDAIRHRNLNEAETFSRRAVELEPGELSFRLNCAEVMTDNRQFDEAMGMLRQAVPLAKTADEVAAVHDRMLRVERSQVAWGGRSVRAKVDGGSGQ